MHATSPRLSTHGTRAHDLLMVRENIGHDTLALVAMLVMFLACLFI
jgi:hypothetical protein